jgi:hypothetical protein
MANILVNNNFYISTSSACVVDLTPPTFAGINFLDVETRGQIRAAWAVATDATAPLRYEVYIKASTATGLFNVANIISSTTNLQFDIFNMPDGSFLVNGTTYFVGVRALDAVSNRDSNTVSLSVISTGILTSIDTYKNEGVVSVDTSNNFRATFWSTKNGNLAVSPAAVLGTASYQVYDKTGAAVVSLTQSGITANAQGMYVITPVANVLDENLRHYVIKVTISVDGENRINHIPVEDQITEYSIDGVHSVDNSNDLIGSFWVLNNEKVVTTNLGTGSYQVYLPNGTIIPGLTETGITADANGFFTISSFPLPPTLDKTLDYIVRISITVNGTVRTHNLVLNSRGTQYTCRSVFSINAGNQLEATFWSTQNEELSDIAILGNASYQIYDKTGAAVAGLTQTGITPDGQGFYHITPVSATLITDLTHYVAKITIEVSGQDRTVAKGFTLLGT